MKRRRAWSTLRAERLAELEGKQGYRAAMNAFQIGEEIRRLRTEHGLSQRELAERMGVAQPVVARLEAGGVEAYLGILDGVANALGVKLDIHFQAEPAEGRAIS